MLACLGTCYSCVFCFCFFGKKQQNVVPVPYEIVLFLEAWRCSAFPSFRDVLDILLLAAHDWLWTRYSTWKYHIIVRFPRLVSSPVFALVFCHLRPWLTRTPEGTFPLHNSSVVLLFCFRGCSHTVVSLSVATAPLCNVFEALGICSKIAIDKDASHFWYSIPRYRLIMQK